MIRLGVVGVGHIFAPHREAVESVEGVQLAALCDHDIDKASAIATELGVPAFGALEDLLGAKVTDAVLIALPHGLHATASIAALAAGQHVVVEKPMAIRVDEVNGMLAAAHRAQRHVLVAESAAAHPGAMYTGERFAAGDLGEFLTGSIINARFYFTEQRPGWFLDPAMSGGGMFANVGLHRLAIARTCLPGLTPVSVSASVRPHGEHPVEACTSALVRYQRGQSMLYEELGYFPVPGWFNGGTHFVFDEGVVGWEPDVWRWQRRDGQQIVEPMGQSRGYAPVYEALVAAVQTGAADRFAGADFGAHVAIVQAAYASGEQGETIDLTKPPWRVGFDT